VFATFVIFSHQAIAEVTSSELFTAISERLGYMEDVALYKARNHLAIEAHGSFEPTGFADFDAAINVEYVTVSDKQLLFKALQKVKLSRDTD